MQKTKTRKTKLVVAMAIILCLAFTAAMGGFTYAKYVSSQTMDAQSATVAKWGYVLNIVAGDLFAEAYGTAAGTKITYETTDGTVGVKAYAANTKLVAPGTTGSMQFSVKGRAEVRAKLVIKLATGNATVKLTNGEDVYEPIKWTLKKGDTVVFEDATMSKIETELAAATNAIYEAGASSDVDDTYTLTWAWAFESGNDEKDTYLGQAANGDTLPEGYTAETTVSFGMTISVEQIQGADA